MQREFVFKRKQNKSKLPPETRAELPNLSELASGSATPGADAKSIILSQYDYFEALKTQDPECKRLLDNKNHNSNQILYHYHLLSNAEGQSEEYILALNDKLNYFSQEHETAETLYHDYLKKKLVPIQQWPDIYQKMITDGYKREDLVNVLTAFSDMQSGKITAAQALSRGTTYMKNKYNLPEDFFKNLENEKPNES